MTKPKQVRVPYHMETLRLAPPLGHCGFSPQGYIPGELHTHSLLELHACHLDLSNKGRLLVCVAADFTQQPLAGRTLMGFVNEQ